MKTGILASPTIASEDMQGSVMGMSVKGMDIAAYFLRDKIYSNKILAVIREYICNAVDEHRKHQIINDVEVRLVKDEDDKWFWSVRDYAYGLDENGVRNIFGMYFESTKSGDNESIGGFGIGSKAGMSYADTFYITSWNSGSKDSYICSLGAGQKGVPVGEIYDISKEPTTEQGIEIRIEVDQYEVSKFHSTTVTFIESFANDVGLSFFSDYVVFPNTVLRPLVPQLTVDIGDGYKLSKYATVPSGIYGTNSVGIRMGGVIYTQKNFGLNNRAVTSIGYHILDVPIGKLTIPISRETIEDTPANTKTYESIKLLLDKLLDEDRNSLKVPKFGDILDEGNNGGYYGARIEGEWFSYQGNTAFPDTYSFINYVRRTSYTKLDRASNGRHTIYLMPDIKNQANWQERLKRAVETLPNYVGHYMATNDTTVQKYMLGSDSLDVSDIDFIDIKQLKLPPLPKPPKGSAQTQYLVYLNGYRQGAFTPDELDAHVTNTRSIVADLDDKWWESVSDIKELEARTIATVKGGGQYHPYYTANSEKFVNLMYEMGWLAPGSQEHNDTIVRINQEQERLERIRNAEPSLRNSYFDTDFHPNVIKAVIRDTNKIDRLNKVRESILSEDSTRARILRKLSRLGGYDGSRRISRGDLRKILTLK